MSDELPIKDGPMTAEQILAVEKLSKEEIEEIDKALMSNVVRHWRKLAMVIGVTMSKLPDGMVGVPDVFYAERMRKLVDAGHVESQGDLSRMRFCEVRLPAEHGEYET